MASKTIDELCLSLGLDLSKLDADFLEAADTVKAKMQLLSKKTQSVKLRTQVEIAGLEGTGNQTDVLKAKLAGLTEQIKLQTLAVKTVEGEYKRSVDAKGKDAVATENLENRLLREQKAQTELANKIRATIEAIKAQEEAQRAAGAQDKIAKLGLKSAQEQIKTDIRVTGLEESGQKIDALRAKISGLKAQMDIQKQTTAALSAEHRTVAAAQGADSRAAQELALKILQSQKAEADLSRQLRRTDAALAEQAAAMKKTQTAAGQMNMSSLKGKFKEATAGAGGFMSALGRLNTAIFTVTATAATLGGLSKFTSGAIEAGNAVYHLQGRMHMSASDAGQLNKVLGMVGVESKTFAATMVRLDKSIQNAGSNGNATTKSLERFGASMTDDNGKLKNYSGQLEALAIAYKKASEAGEEEAFVAEVLGARGAELVPVLREYKELSEAASKVKSIGIDPAEAHQAALEMKTLNMQTGQLNRALGNALLPLVNEFAPQLRDALGETTIYLKEHKGEIRVIGEYAIRVFKTIADVVKTVVGGYIDVMDAPNKLMNALTGQNRTLIDDIREISEAYENLSRNGFFNMQNAEAFHAALEAEDQATAMEAKKKELLDKIQQQEKAAEAERERIRRKTEDELKELDKVSADIAAAEYKRKHNNLENALYDIGREVKEKIAAGKSASIALQEAELKKNAAIQENAEKVYDAIKDAREQAYAADYKANHTDLENELYDIEIERQKLIKTLSDEAAATEIAETKKQNAYKKTAREIQKNREELTEALTKLSKTDLENRLRDIVKERNEWIKKTQDEVAATKLAEKQKRQAIQESLGETLLSEQKRLELVDKYYRGSIGGAELLKEMRKMEIESAGMKIEDFKKYSVDVISLQQKIADAIKKNKYDYLTGGNYDLSQIMNQVNSEMAGLGEKAAADYFRPFKDQAGEVTAQLSNAAMFAARGGAGYAAPSQYPAAGGGVSLAINGGITVSIEQQDKNIDQIIEQAQRKFGAELRNVLEDALANY